MTDCSPIAYQFELFRGQPLRHALSGRVPGAPEQGDVGYARDNDHAAVEANRRAFLAAVGIPDAALTLGKQTHGAGVAVATLPDRGRGQPPRFDAFPATDAIVTDVPAVAPGVFVADCVPLLLYDPRQHALGVVHAGWRGTVALIAAAAVARMTEAFGTRPAELLAGIGPSIGPCCYEVGDEVIAAWRAADVERAEAAVSRPESYHFDLWMANRLALERAGVPRRRIEWSGRCVRCERERFFSYRAASQGLAAPGRMLLAAQLLPLD